MVSTTTTATPPYTAERDSDMIYRRLGKIAEHRGPEAGHTAALVLATLALAFIADRNRALVALMDVGPSIQARLSAALAAQQTATQPRQLRRTPRRRLRPTSPPNSATAVPPAAGPSGDAAIDMIAIGL